MQNLKKYTTGKAIGFGLVFVIIMAFSAYSAEIKQDITDALVKGDTTKAVGLLEEEIKLDPSFEKNYYTLGLIYKKRGHLEKAEEQFVLALNKKKKFWPGVYELGLVELELGKIDEAEARFKAGIKKGKDLKPYFHSGMALAFLKKENFSNADTEIRKAIVIDDNVALFHIILGRIYVQQGVNSLAASSFEKAVALDTLSLDIYFDWAEACIEMKDYQCALEKLQVVLQKDSTHAPAWMKAGGIYYKAARSSRDRDEVRELYGKTIGAYKQFIELSNAVPDSSNGRAYYEAGMAYLKLRAYQESREYFDMVLSIPVVAKDIYFNYGKSWHGVARILQSEGQKSETIVEYDSALVYFEKHHDWVREMEKETSDFKSGIKDVELYRIMGECYKAKKDRFNTISYYKKSLEYKEDQPRLVMDIAVAYHTTQDFANALLYYKKRIDMGIDERFWSLYYNGALCAMYLAEQGPAAMEEEEDLGLEDDDVAEEMPVEDPFEGVDLYDFAIGYLEKIAIDHWDFVSAKESNMKTGIKALSALASTYLYQKSDCVNGIKYFEKVLEYEPNNCEALRSIGYAYFGGICTENYGKALNYFNKSLNCLTSIGKQKCDDKELLLWIAQTYHFRAVDKAAKDSDGSKSDYAKADKWYQEVLKCDPSNQAAKDGLRQVKWEH